MYSSALTIVKGRDCVAHYLSQCTLPPKKMRVIAIGKAAASMMKGVLDIHPGKVEAGLVVTKERHTESLFIPGIDITQIESAHPYPDERSTHAGQQLLQFIEQAPNDVDFLFLISGGTSSLVEVLPDDVDVQQLHRLNRWLLAQAWPIEKMNQIRKSVSLIKAGRLARFVAGHNVMQLLISDVPDNELSVIGSGLLVADTLPTISTEVLPDWIQTMQQQVPAPPAADDDCFARIESDIIASNELLRADIIRQAKQLSLPVQINAVLDGNAKTQGVDIAHTLVDGEAGIYVWGGETVVNLPDQPGQGGRCQHLALAAAQEIAGYDNITLLAIGTDGTDGPGDVAGALVDGTTMQRAIDGGAISVDEALNQADAGRFLAASGDLVDTGPTGTNVMDIVIGLKT